MSQPPRMALTADLGVKFALAGLLLFAVAFPDLPQFEGKAVAWRAIAYPLAVLLVPAAWWLFARRSAYPFAADILLVLPFLIDTAGNAADLYDRID